MRQVARDLESRAAVLVRVQASFGRREAAECDPPTVACDIRGAVERQVEALGLQVREVVCLGALAPLHRAGGSCLSSVLRVRAGGRRHLCHG